MGSYRLVAFRNVADDGEVREPLGTAPEGLVIYSAERYMSTVLMAAGRPHFRDGDILSASVDERAGAFATTSGFAGRWWIDEGEVVHQLEVVSFPNWEHTTQRRPYELEGDELRLYPPRMLMDGKMRRSEVIWRRLQR